MKHTLSTDAHLVLGIVLQETLDTTAGELDGEVSRGVAGQPGPQ